MEVTIYTTTNINGVDIEEYITGRMLRVYFEEHKFKLYVHTVDESTVAVYLCHGEITPKIRTALRQWSKEKGIEKVLWGRDKFLDTVMSN